MTRRTKQGGGSFLISLLLLLVALAAASCANEGVLKSGRETPNQTNAQSEKTAFAQELEAMQTAGFRFVYVLRRKDGGSIDAQDRSVIKLQTADTNRRVSADDGKAFIIGSNAEIPSQNMMALFDRFAVENHSPDPATDTNANANK